MKTRIGELLVKNGIITQEQLMEALEVQKKKNMKLGEILIELGYLGPEELIWMLSEQADIPFVELKPEMLDKELINSFPENLLYNNVLLPLYETENKIYVAVGDPTNSAAIEKIKNFTDKKIVTSGAAPQKIEQLLNKFFLSQHLEKTQPAKITEKMTLEIKADDAFIKLTDSGGKSTEIKGKIKLVIEVDKKRK